MTTSESAPVSAQLVCVEYAKNRRRGFCIAVCTVFNDHYEYRGKWILTEEHIYTRNRKRHVAFARQVLMYLLREHLKLSYPQIAQFLGMDDHTTILYGHRKVREQLVTDPELGQLVAKICELYLCLGYTLLPTETPEGLPHM